MHEIHALFLHLHYIPINSFAFSIVTLLLQETVYLSYSYYIDLLNSILKQIGEKNEY